MPRKLYHTSVKYLAYEGLLSDEHLSRIPRSNIHRWRNESPQRYETFHLNLSEDYDLIKEFTQRKYARTVFRSYVRLIRLALSISHQCKEFRKVIRDRWRVVTSVVQRCRVHIGLTRCLRIVDVSSSTYKNWSAQLASSCFYSVLNKCNRVFTNQLSRPQVQVLKSMLTDPQFIYWPISSIAWHALRTNTLAISLNTWYKYARQLGIKRDIPRSRRKDRSLSIRASRPDQIWHADITAFTTSDNVRHYIYLVVDNYSRLILGCTVHDEVKQSLRVQTLKDVLTERSLEMKPTLLTDGGPENKFTELSDQLIHHRALVEVAYSNSLVEAHNKLIKYNYLYKTQIENGTELRNRLTCIIHDFNNRPHISFASLPLKHTKTFHSTEQNCPSESKTPSKSEKSTISHTDVTNVSRDPLSPTTIQLFLTEFHLENQTKKVRIL